MCDFLIELVWKYDFYHPSRKLDRCALVRLTDHCIAGIKCVTSWTENRSRVVFRMAWFGSVILIKELEAIGVMAAWFFVWNAECVYPTSMSFVFHFDRVVVVRQSIDFGSHCWSSVQNVFRQPVFVRIWEAWAGDGWASGSDNLKQWLVMQAMLHFCRSYCQ